MPLNFPRFLARAFSATRFRVVGNSMAPTLKEGQQVLAYVPNQECGSLRRGAIVVLRHPVLPGQIYIKRIIGLPGEYVRIDGARIYLNETLLDEPYVNQSPAVKGLEAPRRETARLWINDEEEYFVLGDRREDSQDSRSFGPVHLDLILGCVWLRYWPPWAWGSLTHR